jgi:hypothetical protein
MLTFKPDLFMLSILPRRAPAGFGPPSKMSVRRMSLLSRPLRGSVPARPAKPQIPSCSLTSRATSVPSARPFVSRIT